MSGSLITLTTVGDNAVLTLLPGSGAVGSLTLNADQLLEMTVTLGTKRAQLIRDKPPRILNENVVVPSVVIGPSWVIRLEAMTEGSLVAFEHPAFGTLGFVLPCKDVERIVRVLTTHLGMVRSEEVGQIRN